MSVEPKSDVTTRAEIASLDRIRNVSVGLQNPSKPRQATWFRCVTNIAQISFFKELVCGSCATSVTFQTSVTLRTQDLRKAVPLISFASTHHKRRAKPNRGKRNVGGEYQESSLLKVRGNDVIADHRA